MMGTGPFAVPTFRALYHTRHTVLALVTAPLRTNRGKPVPPISCIRDVASEHGTPILDPESVNLPEAQAQLTQLAADLFVVCDYGQILSAATLNASRHGGVNLHASLLPKYRGAAPIQWAVLNGDTETAATVIHMTPQLDAGPCVAQTKIAIGPDDTAVDLETRLADLGAQLVAETIEAIEAGTVQPLPQDPGMASKAPRLKKTDGLIDWTRPAIAIKNHIRAMTPWPASYTFWHRAGGTPTRLILGPAAVVPCPNVSSSNVPGVKNAVPGTVIEAAGHRLVIATGENALAPTSIQPAGKRAMPIDEFLRGYAVRPGDRFGPETEG
jgi:methionyl-tRNA formyltransferase